MLSLEGIIMKKIVLLASMFFTIQAQAGIVVSPVVIMPHITSTSSAHSRATTTSSSASKMTNTAKTLTPNPVKPKEIVKAQSLKPSHTVVGPKLPDITKVSAHPVAGAPVASLNTPSKVMGCQESKEVKIEAKCNK